MKIEELKTINDKFRRHGMELQAKTEQLRGQVQYVHVLYLHLQLCLTLKIIESSSLLLISSIKGISSFFFCFVLMKVSYMTSLTYLPINSS